MSRVTEALNKLNGIAPVALLWANAAIAFFVGISHTAFVLLARTGDASPGTPVDTGFTYVTIPTAAIVLATAIAALVKPKLHWPILKFQAVLLVLGALSALYFGLRIAILGIPSGINFAWNPILFGIDIAYPVYLLQRAFVRDGAPASALVVQSPLWALGVSIAVSAAVIWRVSNVAT